MDHLSHRKGQVTLTLRDRQGNIMPGRKVEIELKNHAFLFGSGAFWVMDLCNPHLPPEKKAELEQVWRDWRAVMNYGTLPFYQGRYEWEEGKTMEIPTLRAAKFMHESGAKVKGHPLCWHTVPARWLTPKSNEEVLENQLFRIRREIAAFKEYIPFWDVINEVVIMPIFNNEPEMNAITRLCREIGRVPLVKKLFDQAHAMDPNATLLLNDFNTSDKYKELIEDCLAAGVGIDVIGIQSHQHQGFWGLEKLHEVLERFSVFNKTIHFTENTFVSGDLMPPHIVDLNDFQVKEWPSTPEGEDRQARDMIAMLDVLFAHPLVEAFTSWNFTDDAWLNAPAGLIRKDGSKKPSYDALYQRVNKDWHTKLTLMTDEKGQVQAQGFRGDYILRCDGREAAFRIGKEETAAELSL